MKIISKNPAIVGLFLPLILAVGFVSGVSRLSADEAKKTTLDCGECHTCENPSAENLCLKPCPSLFMLQEHAKHTVTEAPDSMLLKILVNEYGPVRFNHKLHARMSDMDKGCAECHHYSPEGRIPPCGECHGGEANPANLRQPSLKGAYHRQCLSCHREWSHSTACAVCHIPLGAESLTGNVKDPTDIIGIPHPLITEPVKRVYYTPYDRGPMVTFYHKEHIDLFGLRCVDCHQKENCVFCHDLQKPARLKKSQEEVHAICSGCHGTHKCSKCHDKKEKPAFSHADTGWPLSRFHRGADCRACHPTGKRISKLNKECIGCHAGWNQETFAHAVVGLQLDEIHIEIECADCHVDRKFENKPVCSGCHDDGRDPRKNPPGKKI